MQRRALTCLTALTALTALLVAGCSAPDRTAESNGLANRIGELPGVREVNDSYIADGIEFNESTAVLVFLEKGATANQACAAVATFVESFPDTGIAAEQSELEVRDDFGDPTWSFTMAAEVSDAVGASERCVESRQARAIPRAYAVRVYVDAASDLSRPLVRVNFRGTEVRSPAVGLKLARENVANFDEFEWQILNICGDSLCPPG